MIWEIDEVMHKRKILAPFEKVHSIIQETDVVLTRRQKRLSVFGREMVSPHLVLIYCHSGSAIFRYDMRDIPIEKGQLGTLLPEHMLNQLSCTDDFVFTRIVISASLFAEMRKSTLDSHYDSVHLQPVCTLTADQASALLAMADVISDLAEQKVDRQIMLSQLYVGYQLLDLWRREMDAQSGGSHHADVFNHFCHLVVDHFQESREVQYYATLLRYSPKHFSAIVKEETGGISPAAWIQQYVVAQAKRLIENNPESSLVDISSRLGFSDPTSFYRYFKHTAGFTAKQYRESLIKNNT